MATKASTKVAEPDKTLDSRPKDKGTPPAPVSGPVAPGLNDTRGDDQPVVGHSVEVTDGDHKGFFGIFIEAEGSDAVLRSRGDAGVRITVPITDLVPASPNRR